MKIPGTSLGVRQAWYRVIGRLRHATANYYGAYAFARSAKDLVADRPFDLIIAHDVFALKAAQRLRGRAALIADLVEVPFVEQRSGRYYRTTPALGVFAQNRQHHRIIRKADHVLTIGPAMAAYIDARLGVRAEILQNGPKSFDLKKEVSFADHLGLSADTRIICVVNGMAEGYGLEEALYALTHLPDTVHAVLIGSFSPAEYRTKTLSLIAELGLEARVHILGTMPQDQYLGLISSADLGLLTLDTSIPNMRLSLPNRFFDFLKAGVPFVAHDIDDVKSHIDQFGFGLVCPDPSPQTLAHQIGLALKPEQSARLRNNIQKHRDLFSWENSVQRFSRIIDDMATPVRDIAILANKPIAQNNRIFKMADHLVQMGCRVTVIAKDVPANGQRAHNDPVEFLSVEQG